MDNISKRRVLSLLAVTTLAPALIITGGCAGSRTSESTGEYIDDTVITSRVKTNLVKAKGLDGFDISVTTFKGTVQLSGFVDTEEQREEAQSIAEAVDGVTAIENKISLK